MIRLPIRLLSVVTLGAVLAAQDKVSPNRFVPKDSLVVTRFGAPGLWRQQFQKTKLAKLFEGATLAPLVAKARQGFDEALDAAKKEGGLAPELIDGLMKDYAGEIVMALQVDWDDALTAVSEDRPPHFTAIVSLTPDGKFDLQALAAGLQKVAEEKSNELRDLTVGEHKLRYEAAEMQVTLPALIDGHLVTILSNDLEKHAAKLLATEDRFEGGTAGAPLYVHAELDAAISGLFTAVKARMDAEGAELPFDPIALIRSATGLDCLKTLDLSLSADGEHAMMEMTVTAKDGERGMLGMILLDQGPPKLMRFLPPDAEEFSNMAFDIGALYHTVAKCWTSLGDEVPMTFEAAEAAFTEGMKVRLKEDLIDHLGTEVLAISDSKATFAAMAAADADEPDPMQSLAGSCYALALRNGKAFGESLEKALRARGLHAARKTEEYQGTKVHRLRLAAVFEIEYAVTDEMLLIAAGSDDTAQKQLRGILDARASGATAAPDAVLKRLQGMPDGWNGAGVSSMAGVVRGIGTMIEKVGEQESLPEEIVEMGAMLVPLAAELERLGLGHMVGAWYGSKKGFTSRTRW